MKVSELLSKEIDPAKIHAPQLRNEVTALLDLARRGLGLDTRREWQYESRREKVTDRELLVHKLLLLDIPTANAFAFATAAHPINNRRPQ